MTIWHGERVKATLAYDCVSCRLSYSLSQLRYGLPGEPTSQSGSAP